MVISLYGLFEAFAFILIAGAVIHIDSENIVDLWKEPNVRMLVQSFGTSLGGTPSKNNNIYLPRSTLAAETCVSRVHKSLIEELSGGS